MRPLFDAHNHLQDPRLAPVLEEVVTDMQAAGIERCVVNGTSEADWGHVAELAKRFPDFVQPSFGLHPWRAAARSANWLTTLTTHLDAFPSSGLGECGLDRFLKDFDLDDQREVFRAQLDLAATRNLPLSIHCLKAWGPLLECLRGHPHPARGFLLHSYGGSRELVSELVPLGAYFSFSGHFLHPRKGAVREAFRAAPLDRILLESDAPDMLPPPEFVSLPLKSGDGQDLNHPANLSTVGRELAKLLGLGHGALLNQLADNFQQFFGLPPSWNR